MDSWFLFNSRQTLAVKWKCRSVSFFIADCVVGIMLCVVMMSINWTPMLWDFLISSVNHMEHLIAWIQNSPAGLKLNDQLSLVLATFFKYHLHLCRTYVLSWSWYWFAYLPCVAPICGGSVFVGVLVDFVAVITVHLRCFHLYGQRLSFISRRAIRSTFYAFQEKKWNPLRLRVDYVALDFRQRFFATFQFLFLIALLPTITIYCIVFSGLFVMLNALCSFIMLCVQVFQKCFVGSKYAMYADGNLKLV